MQPHLTLKDGKVIPLSDEVYEIVLDIIQTQEEPTNNATSLEALETEFAELFAGDGPSTDDILEEHRRELEREENKLRRLA